MVLNRFFQNFQFYRIGSVVSEKTQFAGGLKPYETCSKSIINRICDVAKYARFDRIVIIFESSSRGDILAQKYFSRYETANVEESAKEIPIDKYLMQKSAACSGLEVADFIMHAIGGQVRQRLNDGGGIPKRKDFVSVFHNIDKRLISYIEISHIAVNE